MRGFDGYLTTPNRKSIFCFLYMLHVHNVWTLATNGTHCNCDVTCNKNAIYTSYLLLSTPFSSPSIQT